MIKTRGRNESEHTSEASQEELQDGPTVSYEALLELEPIVCDPKGGELCLCRTKPEEILVEVRSGIDVQIIRQTWV